MRGGWRGRFDLVLFNRTRAPLRVELGASSPDPSVRVRFQQRSQVLVPGKEARVGGRVEAHRPMMGTPRRRPFGVRVQGRTTPVSVEGTFHQRAVIGGSLMRVVAIGAVVALWAAGQTINIMTLGGLALNDTTRKNNVP